MPIPVKIKRAADGKIESITLNPNPCENCAFKNKCEKHKQCEELKEENSKLKNQLEIATKALEEYANNEHWSDTSEELYLFAGCFCSDGYKLAENALNQIKQIGEK